MIELKFPDDIIFHSEGYLNIKSTLLLYVFQFSIESIVRLCWVGFGIRVVGVMGNSAGERVGGTESCNLFVC